MAAAPPLFVANAGHTSTKLLESSSFS